jgi:hypothetical protein
MLGFKSPVICTRFFKCESDLVEMLGGVRHRAIVTPLRAFALSAAAPPPLGGDSRAGGVAAMRHEVCSPVYLPSNKTANAGMADANRQLSIPSSHRNAVRASQATAHFAAATEAVSNDRHLLAGT